MARVRLKAWYDETHGQYFELVRHFLARFFDSEMTSGSGDWLKVAIGIFAAVLSAGILMTDRYMYRYDQLLLLPASGPYRAAMREDVLLFAALGAAITALLTLLEWHSLFPTQRDCLTLAGLPVAPRRMFLAKFTALTLLFGAFVLTLAGPPALLFTAVSGGPYRENPSVAAHIGAIFAATAGACAFAFFGLVALQGVLLHLLPARLFARVSQAVQAGLFVAAIAALPLIDRQPDAWWWPPSWFLRLWEAVVTGPGILARPALLAVTIPPAASVLAYVLSYHRYRRVLLESGARSAKTPGPAHLARRVETSLDGAGTSVRATHELGAFAFIWKTLARSGMHRLILTAYCGLGLGWLIRGAADIGRPSLRDQGLYGFITVLAPLALSLLITSGLRYLFSMPVALEANWLFRTTDGACRAAWLRAVERFVVCCGILPIYAVAFPAAIAVFGPLRAAAAIGLGLLASLLWFERAFGQWRKLPFTCSYLPGKQPMWMLLARFLVVVPLLGPFAKLLLYCSGEPAAFCALGTLLAVAWWRWRRSRRARWGACTLLYEEVAESPVTDLGLEAGEGTLTRGGESPQAAPEMFSAGLVESRGLLPAAWAEEIREERRGALLETFLEDAKYGFRLIRRSPLLSAVVVLTLTVGIGINASVFTVVNGLALRPHVYNDPDSFLRIFPQSRADFRTRPASYAEYLAFQEQTATVRQLAAFGRFPAIVGDDDAAISFGMLVSCNFFQVDGQDRAIAGRLLNADDCRSGQAPVAVISEGLWRQRFSAARAAIGRVVNINSRPVLLVGVVPDRTAGWTFPSNVWIPYTAQPYFDPSSNLFQDRDEPWLWLAGRLAPGYSRGRAEAEFSILARRQDRLKPERHTAIHTTDGSWISELELTFSGRELMMISCLLAAFNLVLFISCANVATLLLSRAAARRREIAVRLSLGAPRIRLVRMLVTESLVLAAIAGVVSVLLTVRVPQPLYRFVATRAPDFPMPVDWRTYGYVAAVVIVTGILSGLAPALESLKVDLTGTLKGSGGLFGAAAGMRMRGLLVSAQVALSMVLLVGAAMFTQSENRTLRADPGYAVQQLTIAPLRFPDNTPQDTLESRMRTVIQRVKAVPGVRAVSYSEGLPLFSRETVDLRLPLRPDASLAVDVYPASSGYMGALGIPLLGGRDFDRTDTSAAIVSQSIALAMWRRQSPLGKTLPLSGGIAPVIVGVARDVEPLRFGGSDNPAVYQVKPKIPTFSFLCVRFEGNASQGAAALRAAIREADPNLMVIARRMQDWIDQVTETLWNMVSLILVLGLVGTVLATTGIYGAVSFAVNQRTRELGIRVALGASRLNIVAEVLRAGGKPVLHGLLAGLWLSAAVAAGLRQSAKGSALRLDSADPLLYAGAALLLAAAALLAMAGPARRGARADPLAALRCD